MKFKHRLAYYLLGVLIGGMFLIFIFQNKKTEFCYMPNCRVLKNIRSKPLFYSDAAKAKMQGSEFTIDDIKKATASGNVDFSKSNKPGENGGKIYVIESENAKGEPIVIKVVNFDEKVILDDIKKQ
ncbi:hypothetical protein CHU92_09260 [Flavobacterium cyanobacteriorum]|uniref:DUF4258 domain-containing protein n=1 Tax=Flavobacterium cyanobacteriorum TaxID=2022802 RepID=A0A255Z5G2_9FLAO|nr:DUF4258 domain-containing protein [Flavobacterium cyanobacteriorum]OYQ36773.1 hypothetical protein CHU92_09260 [Flavobacterium cyanobacteriorum]